MPNNNSDQMYFLNVGWNTTSIDKLKYQLKETIFDTRWITLLIKKNTIQHQLQNNSNIYKINNLDNKYYNYRSNELVI